MQYDSDFNRVRDMLYEYKTYDIAIRNIERTMVLTKDPKHIKLLADKLDIKRMNKQKIDECIPLFDVDEMMIWDQRFIRGLSPDYIYDTNNMSKSCYYRLQRRIIRKVMKCLGLL